jgi:hypothetical protein
MRMPRFLACSITVSGTEPSAHTPNAPILALQPLASAVAAAAESVEREFAACVVISPTFPSAIILSLITIPSL